MRAGSALATVGRFLLVLTGLQIARPVPAVAGPPAADNGAFVAFIEEWTPSEALLADVVIIKRNGMEQKITSNSMDLMDGDLIFLRRRDAAIAVRMLADNTLIPVRKALQTSPAEQADHKIRAVLPGLSGNLFAFVKHIMLGPGNAHADSSIAGSRAVPSGSCYNETRKTNEPTPFRIPILTASSSVIAPGRRALFVSWFGGVPPFSVTLSMAETGQIVAGVPAVRNTCATYLPLAELPPGHYRLTITDANNFKEQEDSLFVASSVPNSPRELREADLPDEARQIYTATWLAALDNGKWAFEAQQRVAAMDCHSNAVQSWLGNRGGLPPCGQR